MDSANQECTPVAAYMRGLVSLWWDEEACCVDDERCPAAADETAQLENQMSEILSSYR